MKVFKDNISRWKNFINSDYFSLLNGSKSEELSWVFDSLYLDPDYYDIDLYKKLGAKYQKESKRNYLVDYVRNNEIYLSSDMIFGYKQLLLVCDEDYERFLSVYENIFSNINLYFIWPKHKSPTINTLRYAKYRDRIDCLLYDLKLYFEGENTPMEQAYSKEETRIWLSQFASFKDFINEMKLNKFVDEQYNIYDISAKNTELLTNILTPKEITKSISNYIKYVIELNDEEYFN